MKNKNLTEGNIKHQLVSMTWPMIFGMMGIVIFNLVDTYFLGKLGVDELAAIGYIFPIIMVLNSIALGIGVGTSSLISRNIIGETKEKVKELATRSIILGLSVVILIIIIGELTIRPLFTLLGAEEPILSLIDDYMRIWYPGVIFVVIPMIGNNIVRAIGDTFLPGMLMVVSALVNAVLDPFMIFGIGFFPAMGIKGAAIATIIGRGTGLIFILFVLIKKYDLLTYRIGYFQEILDTWKKILYVAGPATISMLITPLSIGFLTRIISDFGESAVAAFGVSIKIESFAIMVIHALGSVMVIFAGQNFGVKNITRIFKAIRYSVIFSICWGLFIFLLTIFFANPIASIFSKNSEVIQITADYLKIISFSYCFFSVMLVSLAIFNGINRPIPSAVFSALRMIGLYVPIAWITSGIFGLTAIFWSGFAANIIVGIFTFFWLNKTLLKIK